MDGFRKTPKTGTVRSKITELGGLGELGELGELDELGQQCFHISWAGIFLSQI